MALGVSLMHSPGVCRPRKVTSDIVVRIGDFRRLMLGDSTSLSGKESPITTVNFQGPTLLEDHPRTWIRG